MVVCSRRWLVAGRRSFAAMTKRERADQGCRASFEERSPGQSLACAGLVTIAFHCSVSLRLLLVRVDALRGLFRFGLGWEADAGLIEPVSNVKWTGVPTMSVKKV